MRIDYSKLAAGLLVTVFGTLSILGHALHSLPGLNHFSPDASSACCHCCGHSTPLPPGGDRDAGVQGERCGAVSHDCPICEFLALAKSHEAHAALPVSLQELGLAGLLRSDSPSLATLWTHSARGPPHAADPV